MNRVRKPQDATAGKDGQRVVSLAGRARARRVARLFDRLEEVARRIPPERLALVLSAGSGPAAEGER